MTRRATLTELLGPKAREYAHGRMKIPSDALLRIEWPNDPGRFHGWYYTTAEHFRHCFPKGAIEKKRLASLHVSSYTEIGSAGASHWQASIRADVIVKEYDGTVCGGYLGKANPKGWTDHIKIEVSRKIKAGERDAWGRRLGRAGERTIRLALTKEEAYDLGIAEFRKRFGQGWMLVDDRNDDAILAET